MEAVKFTINADICDNVSSFLKEQYGDRSDVFIYPMFDDEIMVVADGNDVISAITHDVRIICQYAKVERPKKDILK